MSSSSNGIKKVNFPIIQTTWFRYSLLPLTFLDDDDDLTRCMQCITRSNILEFPAFGEKHTTYKVPFTTCNFNFSQKRNGPCLLPLNRNYDSYTYIHKWCNILTKSQLYIVFSIVKKILSSLYWDYYLF